jgi:PAS domain-containing protein
MLREQQIEASRMRAILEAVADGVLVTDESIRVTLFNASAQRILNVKPDQIVGQPMDQFAGLFGRPLVHGCKPSAPGRRTLTPIRARLMPSKSTWITTRSFPSTWHRSSGVRSC